MHTTLLHWGQGGFPPNLVSITPPISYLSNVSFTFDMYPDYIDFLGLWCIGLCCIVLYRAGVWSSIAPSFLPSFSACIRYIRSIVFFEYLTIPTDTLPVRVLAPEAAFHVSTRVSIRGARSPSTGVNNLAALIQHVRVSTSVLMYL